MTQSLEVEVEVLEEIEVVENVGDEYTPKDTVVKIDTRQTYQYVSINGEAATSMRVIDALYKVMGVSSEWTIRCSNSESSCDLFLFGNYSSTLPTPPPNTKQTFNLTQLWKQNAIGIDNHIQQTGRTCILDAVSKFSDQSWFIDLSTGDGSIDGVGQPWQPMVVILGGPY